MKLLILLLMTSSFAWSKPTHINFNEALLQDVQTDIQRDEDKFKAEPKRGPASVEQVEVRPTFKEEPKIDKHNRQIGPKNW
jgi:hypothetical protein